MGVFAKVGLVVGVVLLAGWLAACAAADGAGAADAADGAADAADGAVDTVDGVVETAVPVAALPDMGAAPEIANAVWINSDGPLTLSEQRGKVVLVEFWTFGCVNCRRVIPYVRDWYETYGGADFTVLSVHYPEFAYERDVENVRAAVAELDVPYPVAIDNDRETWGAYNQRYWPTLYLVDRDGRIRYTHIGEGAYAETEAAIRALIGEGVKDEG